MGVLVDRFQFNGRVRRGLPAGELILRSIRWLSGNVNIFGRNLNRVTGSGRSCWRGRGHINGSSGGLVVVYRLQSQSGLLLVKDGGTRSGNIVVQLRCRLVFDVRRRRGHQDVSMLRWLGRRRTLVLLVLIQGLPGTVYQIIDVLLGRCWGTEREY